MGWQWHQMNQMQAICTLLQKITMPAPHQSDFYGPDALPDTQPTASKHWRNNISQGSVGIFEKCGEIFNADFIAGLLTSLSVIELWKSVSIWRSYGQKYSVPFFPASVYNRSGLLDFFDLIDSWLILTLLDDSLHCVVLSSLTAGHFERCTLQWNALLSNLFLDLLQFSAITSFYMDINKSCTSRLFRF